MARFKTGRLSFRGLPTGRPLIVPGDIRSSVETKPCDHSKCVSVARVNRDPSAGALLAELSQVGRTHRSFDQSRACQHVRNSAGTIVGIVGKGMMAAAETI